VENLHALALQQYDRLIRIDLDDVVVDGCITKGPCRGEEAGRSPVDRGKRRPKRSTLIDSGGVPLSIVSTGANRHDAPLPALPLTGWAAPEPLPAGIAAHLDRGYDSGVTWTLLTSLAITGEIARKGVPAPLQVGKRWVVDCGYLRHHTLPQSRGARSLPLAHTTGDPETQMMPSTTGVVHISRTPRRW